MGELVSEDQRKAYIRAAFAAVAEEMIEVGPTKSGHVEIHYKNGVPMVVDWRILGVSISQVLRQAEGE